MNDATPAISLHDLVREIEKRATATDRMVIAVAGPPGSGKSTLATELAAHLAPGAAVLPMDGFHLDNDALRALGLFDRKGAPETFDVHGFLDLLRDLRAKSTLSYPTFDRDADRTVPHGGTIEDGTRIVIVEGNYLLLKVAPWAGMATFFDLTIGLDVPQYTLEARLIRRWVDHGLPPDQARTRARGNDMRNAKFVVDNSFSPDFTLKTGN